MLREGRQRREARRTQLDPRGREVMTEAVLSREAGRKRSLGHMRERERENLELRGVLKTACALFWESAHGEVLVGTPY